MTIAQDVQSLTPGATVQLFELDLTAFGEGIFRFHPGVNELLQPVFWQGNEFLPLPVEVGGLEVSSKGMPRPVLRVANLGGLFSPLLKSYDDLIGCKVTAIKTHLKYLDAVNFASGVNALADPTAEYPRHVFRINQKKTELPTVLEFELASPLEVDGISLPRCIVLGDVCTHPVYRGPDCGYTGAVYLDAQDQPTDAAGDVCGRRIASCEKRFGSDGVLRHSGFPGAALVPGVR
jgi:lambda family phage minor tail protein L